MTALSAFADFVATTGSSYLTDADSILNECVKNSYVLRRFLKGADRSFVLQGGANIKDILLLDYTETAQMYSPNESFTWVNPQNLTNYQLDWKYLVDHMSWTDQELILQNPKAMKDVALRGFFKDLKRSKEMRMWTSKINFLENQLWRTPNLAEMETASPQGLYFYSILSGVNEYSLGLYNTGDISGLVGGNWTTYQQISPTTYSRWQPQRQIYNDTSITASMADQSGTATAGTGINIIQAFDREFYRVRFEAPPTKQAYFEDNKLYSQVIFCSRQGINIYQNLLRQSQDRFTGIASYQDPAYASPSFAGIDLQYVAQLDSATNIATNGTNLFSEGSSSATNQGPRYWWINTQFMCPVFHTDRYFEMHPTMRPTNQPFTTIAPVDTWMNLVIRSRQRLGVVYPQGALYTY